MNIRSAALYQRKFIETAYKLLKPGGILLYSTCSVSYEGKSHVENQENVAWALQNFSLELILQDLIIGDPSEPNSLTQSFSPVTHSMGFFIAKLRKTTHN